MGVLGTGDADRAVLRQRIAAAGRHVVAFALCAAWCTTCREFRIACERVAAACPDVSLVWIDVEDDADLLGDFDIETFPTLAIFAGEAPLHFGVVVPRAELVERLVTDLGALSPGTVPPEIAALVTRLTAG